MFAVKIAQSGGLQGAASVASIAAAAGIELYGGTMLEGAAGTMASAQLFSTFDSLKWGTELFGPLLLTEEISSSRCATRISSCTCRQRPASASPSTGRIERMRRDAR